MDAIKIIAVVLTLFGLLWLWPNLIHEPLHYVALQLQGADGHINFDWSFPPHPSITKVGQVAGIGGGLLYLLLPSVVSVLLLLVLWVSRSKAGLLTHVVLPAYLTFDLIINILKYEMVQSDFHFLTVLPIWVRLVLMGVCALLGAAVLYSGISAMPKTNEVLDVS
jgi:hypothetical protein